MDYVNKHGEDLMDNRLNRGQFSLIKTRDCKRTVSLLAGKRMSAFLSFCDHSYFYCSFLSKNSG